MLAVIITLALEAPGDAEFAVSPRVVVSASPDSGRRLRADFALPDAVLVVDSSRWPVASAYLIAELEARVPTIILEENASLLDDTRLRPGPGGDALVMEVRLDSGWIRDYGPLQVDGDDGVHWLNAGYHMDRSADDDVPNRLATSLRQRLDDLPIALEGGGIISNGAGLCASTTVTVERAMIDVHDRPYVDALMDALGCRVWAIVPALENDATGHVDMFAQFVSGERVILSSLDRRRAERDARRLDDAAFILTKAAATLGIRLEVARIPMPIDRNDRYLTFVNGTRVKGAFLVPSYDAASTEDERRAYRAIKGALGDDTLISIPADELIALGGAIHCATLGIALQTKSAR